MMLPTSSTTHPLIHITTLLSTSTNYHSLHYVSHTLYISLLTVHYVSLCPSGCMKNTRKGVTNLVIFDLSMNIDLLINGLDQNLVSFIVLSSVCGYVSSVVSC